MFVIRRFSRGATLGKRRPVWQIRLNPRSRSSRRPCAATRAWVWAARHCDAWCASTPYLRKGIRKLEMVITVHELVEALQRLRQRASLIMAMQRE